MNNTDLALLIWLGITGVYMLVTFVRACWSVATVTRGRRRSRGW
ncbi:hypothetical protein [Actinomadura sp. 9N215]